MKKPKTPHLQIRNNKMNINEEEKGITGVMLIDKIANMLTMVKDMLARAGFPVDIGETEGFAAELDELGYFKAKFETNDGFLIIAVPVIWVEADDEKPEILNMTNAVIKNNGDIIRLRDDIPDVTDIERETIKEVMTYLTVLFDSRSKEIDAGTYGSNISVIDTSSKAVH